MSYDSTTNNDKLPNNTVNSQVIFSKSRVADLLRNLEIYLGIPLSIRSITGEVVCKTDYFYGPCSFIRGTKVGCERCRKVYKNIENKIMRRKVPYVCFCYCGFLVFAIPLEFRGEMLGILFGSQIMPGENDENHSEAKNRFESLAKQYGIEQNKEFIESFSKIKTLDSDSQRLKFLNYMTEVGHNFVEMAVADKPWSSFLSEIKTHSPEFGTF